LAYGLRLPRQSPVVLGGVFALNDTNRYRASTLTQLGAAAASSGPSQDTPTEVHRPTWWANQTWQTRAFRIFLIVAVIAFAVEVALFASK